MNRNNVAILVIGGVAAYLYFSKSKSRYSFNFSFSPAGMNWTLSVDGKDGRTGTISPGDPGISLTIGEFGFYIGYEDWKNTYTFTVAYRGGFDTYDIDAETGAMNQQQ